MDFIKKYKLILIGIVIVVAGVGGYFIFTRGKPQSKTPAQQEQNVKQLTPSDIGLVLTAKKDGKAVIMRVTKLTGIQSIEYEVSYDAEVTEEGETNNIPRGVVGSPIEIKGKSEIEREVLLGTCSASVCKYDKVTSAIKFLIKVNFSNGEIGSVEDTISLGEE